ncbi:unnamed protein product [Strongylus vulgaris]|uniref:HORMA domain-containing protein n=1 Tax=Strongylus vulgaris TaxID=40348 RepID=A0A3P7IXU1_STRVU|nr:unnamed protein product [Strongylus vulgaris]
MQKNVILAIAGATVVVILIATGITLAVVLTRKSPDPDPEEDQNSTTTLQTLDSSAVTETTLPSTSETSTEITRETTVTSMFAPISSSIPPISEMSTKDSSETTMTSKFASVNTTTTSPITATPTLATEKSMPPFAAAVKKNPYRKEIDKKSRFQWAATFPEDVEGLSESTVFITRCMYITFSHILSCRRLMPSNVFKKRTIDGDLRAYVMDTSELLGARFVQKFKGINSAVEKGYLHELMLVVTPTEEDDKDAIEMYTWRMRYDIDGDPQAELRMGDGTVMAALRFQGMQHLKKQVTELLLMLRALCRELLSPLPPTASSALRITYTDRTPKGYQAPGFYRSPEDPILRPDAQEIEVVAFQTKHHGASVAVKSIFIDDAYAVGLRLKETMKLDGLDDSLNQSFGEEQGAGDEVQAPSDETLERISGPLEGQIFDYVTYQSDTVEVPRGEQTTDEREVQDTSTMSTSTMGARGSSINTVLSESIRSEEPRPRRGRRGHPAAAKIKPGQPIEERAKSPVVVSGYLHELMLVVTPTEEDDKDAIEMYTWRMRYDIDGDPQAELRMGDGTVMAALRFQGMQHLKKQVTELLLMLRALCRELLSPLPPTASSALRITYTDRTPKGYQAPGFYRSPEDPILRPDAQEIEVVAFQTKHHGASVAVKSIFIDDAYAVGLRLKETMKLDGLDDSLNQSFGEEQGAGDEVQAPSDETLERISGPLEGQIFDYVTYQSDTVEVPRGEQTTDEREVQDTSTMSTSTMGARGSSINTVLSESIRSEEPRPRRGRRGHPAAAKVKPGQPIEERAKSPVVVSASPKRLTTPGPEMEVVFGVFFIKKQLLQKTSISLTFQVNHDTPPTKRTPDYSKAATDKEEILRPREMHKQGANEVPQHFP